MQRCFPAPMLVPSACAATACTTFPPLPSLTLIKRVCPRNGLLQPLGQYSGARVGRQEQEIEAGGGAGQAVVALGCHQAHCGVYVWVWGEKGGRANKD